MFGELLKALVVMTQLFLIIHSRHNFWAFQLCHKYFSFFFWALFSRDDILLYLSFPTNGERLTLHSSFFSSSTLHWSHMGQKCACQSRARQLKRLSDARKNYLRSAYDILSSPYAVDWVFNSIYMFFISSFIRHIDHQSSSILGAT